MHLSLRSSCLIFFAVVFGGLSALAVPAQQNAVPQPDTVFFVVSRNSNSTTLEPLAVYRGGKLQQTVSGSDDTATLTRFAKLYYPKGQRYNVSFGGGKAGSVTVQKSNVGTECIATFADATLQTTAPINGRVRGLATNAAVAGQGFRRAPTAAERARMESVVVAEFSKNMKRKVAASEVKTVNLTAIDLDGDTKGLAEMVGSYYVAASAKDRRLLFVAAKLGATKAADTALVSKYQAITAKDIFEGVEFSAVGAGNLYTELLVDAFDINGDGRKEIFTFTEGLEGNSFSVYQENGSEWHEVLAAGNYRCGF